MENVTSTCQKMSWLILNASFGRCVHLWKATGHVLRAGLSHHTSRGRQASSPEVAELCTPGVRVEQQEPRTPGLLCNALAPLLPLQRILQPNVIQASSALSDKK